MALEIIQNQTGYVNPFVSAVDTGWTISDIYAIHKPCNAGSIKSLTSLGVVVGQAYTITYTVDNYVSGYVRVIAGDTEGLSRTANGTYTETITVTSIAQISFYSDGDLRVSVLKFFNESEGLVAGKTVSFNEGENKWGADFSFHPEFMIKFLDQFLSVKNGSLWLHDSNPVRGNFYGEQFPATVELVINIDYKKDKLFYNLRIDGKGKWYAPVIEVAASDQFPNGMQSRLKRDNVKLINGKLWADFLRDLNDPNFATISNPTQRAVTALYNGRMLQGPWMVIQMRCDDTTETYIASMEVYYDDVERSL